MSSTEILLDAAGHHRSPVTMPGYHHGKPRKDNGRRFRAEPPPVEEIIAVMRAISNDADGAPASCIRGARIAASVRVAAFVRQGSR